MEDQSRQSTASFHPAFLERTLPMLEGERFCLSAMMPLDSDESRPHEYALKLRATARDLEKKLKERAGLYPYFSESERDAMMTRIEELKNMEDKAFRPFLDDKALAIYITPEHTIMLGLPDTTQAMTMVSDHPYKLPLLTSARHFYDKYFYLVEVAKNAMKLYRMESDGESSLLIDRKMGDDIDYRPAADYADDQDEPLQFHGAGDGERAIYHGHASNQEDHLKARQQRFWRDTYEEVLQIIDHSGTGRHGALAPVILRGEERQRNAFFEQVDTKEDDFTMQTNLSSEGSLKEQALKLRDELRRQDTRHDSLRSSWDRAKSQGRTETNTTIIARQAAQGLIDTLCISSEEALYGEYDMDTGDLLIHDNERMSSGEVRDLIARKVLELGGQIHVLSSDQMPSPKPFAAILRSEAA